MYEIVGRRQGCISLNHQDYELGKKTAVRLHMIFFQISAFFCKKITHVPVSYTHLTLPTTPYV